MDVAVFALDSATPPRSYQLATSSVSTPNPIPPNPRAVASTANCSLGPFSAPTAPDSAFRLFDAAGPQEALQSAVIAQNPT